ncbi:MAG: hypothetical protein QXO03_00185 [Thermoplasmatales archaeon]
MFGISFLLNPPAGLSAFIILIIALILGMLHGITPDEHTWPITFSYSVGSYSTKGGMRAGFTFSAGFTAQRAILTILGFAGFATIYERYNLDGYIYIVVGVVMLVVGYYLIRGTDLHIPLDRLFGGSLHHTTRAERVPMREVENTARPIPLKMALVHGFIAGWGFGGFATIITFILAPQMPNIYYAALVGVMFGIGTMIMQVVIGALFANIMRMKKLSVDQIKYVGRSTSAKTLYYGGIAFALIGVAIAAFPSIEDYAISTGNPIPNLNSLGVATFLVILVVGVIGIGSMYKSYRQISSRNRNLQHVSK